MKELLERRSQGESVEKLEKQIDKIVFSLYGLSNMEIEQIEKKYNVQ